MKPGSAARICRALWLAVLIAVPSLNAQTDPRRSGFEFMSSAIQAMQKDDALNMNSKPERRGSVWALTEVTAIKTASRNARQKIAADPGFM